MKELAGGRDEWQQPGDAPQRVTWEAVQRYAPEVLILCPCSSNLDRSLGEVCNLAAQPGWWALPAVKTGRVYICDHSFFSRPGPRYCHTAALLTFMGHLHISPFFSFFIVQNSQTYIKYSARTHASVSAPRLHRQNLVVAHSCPPLDVLLAAANDHCVCLDAGLCTALKCWHASCTLTWLARQPPAIL